MTDLTRDLGNVFPDRSMQSGLSFAPREVDLAGKFLTWRRQEVSYTHPKPGMLADFSRLFEGSDREILSYARRWGVLGICKHGLPCSHNQYPYDLRIRPCLPMLVTPLPAKESDLWFQEPLHVWRKLSRKATALMNIGAQLNQGKKAQWEDWQVIKEVDETGLGFEVQAATYMQGVASARKELAWELDGWISIGQVRPRISWENKAAKWRFSLDALSSGPNLFGLLALSIALAIAGTEFAVCSGCGRPYWPDRRPDPNRRSYCYQCREKKIPQRDAARDFRNRTECYRSVKRSIG